MTRDSYGADGFAYATRATCLPSFSLWKTGASALSWSCPIPKTATTPNHSPFRERSGRAQQVAHDQACRQRWRAHLLVIEAKLEVVAAGIPTIETQFVPNTVLPDNTTADEWMLAQVDRAYRTGEMLSLLPAAGNDALRSTAPIPLTPA